MGKQRTYADQPSGFLSSRCVPIWESPEPGACDRETAAVDEGRGADMRTRRKNLRSFAGAGTTILAAAQQGYQAVGIEVTDAYFQLGTERVREALKEEVDVQ